MMGYDRKKRQSVITPETKVTFRCDDVGAPVPGDRNQQSARPGTIPSEKHPL